MSSTADSRRGGSVDTRADDGGNRTRPVPGPRPVARDGGPFVVPPLVRVGLWGAPESGKTTFLSALFLAANQLGRTTKGAGPIAVTAQDKLSEEFQVSYPQMLAVEKRFPEATGRLSVPFEWRFSGDLRRTRFAPHRRFIQARHVPLDFILRLRDLPGGAFLEPFMIDADAGSGGDLDLIGELANCGGLIYLFDPQRESHNGDSFAYFHGIVTRLKRRADTFGQLIGGKLPHRLSVCITKFDDERTFAEAKLTGLVGVHPETGQPCIPQKKAEEYFDRTCATTGGSAGEILDAIRADFLPERTRYYAVSSVGFSNGRDGQVWDRENPSNVRREGLQFLIRDPLRPINVLDAVIDVERALRVMDR